MRTLCKQIIILALCGSISHAYAAEWEDPDMKPAEKRSESPAPARLEQPPQVQRQPSPPTPASIPEGSLSVEVIQVCNFQTAYTDKGSGGRLDVSFFDPLVPPGYLIIGGYAQGNHHQPSDCIKAIKPVDSASRALVQAPQDWQLIWTDKNSGAYMDGSIWHPVSADNNYICLGSIAREGYNRPVVSNYGCLHQCLLQSVPVTNFIWSDKGTGANTDVSIYRLHNSNGYRAIPSHQPPASLVDIKTNASCQF